MRYDGGGGRGLCIALALAGIWLVLDALSGMRADGELKALEAFSCSI